MLLRCLTATSNGRASSLASIGTAAPGQQRKDSSMNTPFTLKIRVGFVEAKGTALKIVGYRARRTGYQDGKPVFTDERIQLVAFDALAEQLASITVGSRHTFLVERRERASGGSYLKIVGVEVQESAPQQDSDVVQPESVPLEELPLDELLERVRENPSPEANVICIMAALNAPEARRRAIALLQQGEGATFEEA